MTLFQLSNVRAPKSVKMLLEYSRKFTRRFKFNPYLILRSTPGVEAGLRME